MLIFNYQKFQLLLEAKIQFLNNLKNILGKMDHPLAHKILALKDRDLAININYFNTKDINYLTFFPDDKVKEWEWIITDNSAILYLPIVAKKYDISSDANIFAGMVGTIISDINLDLIKKHYPRLTYTYDRVVIFETEEGKALVDVKYLQKIKPVGTEQSGKVGRIFKTLLTAAGYSATEKEIEDLVNNYKKVISDKSTNMELVQGEEIRKYYSHKSGSSIRKGTLAGSCMRYDYCQPYLDIYVENSNIYCLVLKSEDEPDKIMARALVWKLVDGKYFMDRIYCTHDYEVGTFIDYARERGWIYKDSQNSLPSGLKLGHDYYNDKLKVQLEKIEFSSYPYLDTLKWMDWGQKTLSNVNNGTFPLESTEGEMGVGCDFCSGDGRVDCPECDGDGYEDCDFCSGNGRIDCPECG